MKPSNAQDAQLEYLISCADPFALFTSAHQQLELIWKKYVSDHPYPISRFISLLKSLDPHKLYQHGAAARNEYLATQAKAFFAQQPASGTPQKKSQETTTDFWQYKTEIINQLARNRPKAALVHQPGKRRKNNTLQIIIIAILFISAAGGAYLLYQRFYPANSFQTPRVLPLSQQSVDSTDHPTPDSTHSGDSAASNDSAATKAEPQTAHAPSKEASVRAEPKPQRPTAAAPAPTPTPKKQPKTQIAPKTVVPDTKKSPPKAVQTPAEPPGPPAEKASEPEPAQPSPPAPQKVQPATDSKQNMEPTAPQSQKNIAEPEKKVDQDSIITTGNRQKTVEPVAVEPPANPSTTGTESPPPDSLPIHNSLSDTNSE